MAKVTRKGLHFHSTVNSDSNETDKYNVRQDATIEHIGVRFYPGQQLDLELELHIVSPNGSSKEIVDPVGEKPYLAGDDDLFKFDVSVPIQTDDTIKVIARNQDTAGNDYDYIVNMEIDRINGIERVLNKFEGVL